MIRPGESTANRLAFLSGRISLPLDVTSIPERDQESAVLCGGLVALLNIVPAEAKSEPLFEKSLDGKAGAGIELAFN